MTIWKYPVVVDTGGVALRPTEDAGAATPADTSSTGARIVQINLSAGGVPKHPVSSIRVTVMGLEGDAHRDRRRHGGPDRALCLFSHECIRTLQAEGHPITPGSIGENLTVAGIDWNEVVPATEDAGLPLIGAR